MVPNREITGLSRVMLTTFAKCNWFPTAYKAFLYACADYEKEAEHPHHSSTVLRGGPLDGEVIDLLGISGVVVLQRASVG